MSLVPINKLNDFLDQINQKVQEKLNACDNYDVNTRACTLLFLLAYYEKSEDPAVGELCQKLIDTQISKALTARDSSNDNLNNVLTSSWLFQYLVETEIIPGSESEFLTFTDDYLSLALDSALAQENFTVRNGIIRIGHYWLKRDKNHEVERIIRILDLKKQAFNDGIAWIRFCPERYSFLLDMSFESGNVGIVDFLMNCYANNIAKDTCATLISGSFDFYNSTALLTKQQETLKQLIDYPLINGQIDTTLYLRNSSWEAIMKNNFTHKILLPIYNGFAQLSEKISNPNLHQLIKIYFHVDGIQEKLFTKEVEQIKTNCFRKARSHMDKNFSSTETGGKTKNEETLMELTGLGLILLASQESELCPPQTHHMQIPMWLLS